MYRCEKCGDEFDSLPDALKHCQAEHGMSRQEAQNELKIHARK